MDRRLKLHKKFTEVLPYLGKNIHFQPPNGYKLKYPCVLYSKVGMNHTYADNKLYVGMDEYKVTVIETDPDGSIAYDILNEFKRVKFNTKFNNDGLYHTEISLYY